MDVSPVSPPFVRGAFRITLVSLITAFLALAFTVIFGVAGIIIPIASSIVFLFAFTRYDFLASKFSANATKIIFGIAALFSFLAFTTPDPVASSIPAKQERVISASNNVIPFDEVHRATTATRNTSYSTERSMAPITSSTVLPNAATPVAKKSVSTTVDEVLKTYADNQMAGERKFGGAEIMVAGRVERVREAFGIGILVLRSNRADGPLELSFVEAANDDLIALTPGQSVNAVCYGIVELMGAVSLGDCRSVK